MARTCASQAVGSSIVPLVSTTEPSLRVAARSLPSTVTSYRSGTVTVTEPLVPKLHTGKATSEGRMRRFGAAPSASTYATVNVACFWYRTPWRGWTEASTNPSCLAVSTLSDPSASLAVTSLAPACSARSITSKMLNWPAGSGVVFSKLTSTLTVTICSSGATV